MKITTTEAAALIGVTKRRVIAMIASGKLPATRDSGGRWQIDANQAIEAADASRPAGRPKAISRTPDEIRRAVKQSDSR